MTKFSNMTDRDRLAAELIASSADLHDSCLRPLDRARLQDVALQARCIMNAAERELGAKA